MKQFAVKLAKKPV